MKRRLPPSNLMPPPVAAATAEVDDLVAQRDEAMKAKAAAVTAVVAAKDTDRAALADALRGKCPDPGQKATNAATNALADVERRHEALNVAVSRAETDLASAIEKALPKWRADITEQGKKQRATYLGSVDQLDSERAALLTHAALERWVADPAVNFGDHGNGGWVRDIVGPNGDPYQWITVAASLRRDGDEPDAPQAAPGISKARPMPTPPDGNYGRNVTTPGGRVWSH